MKIAKIIYSYVNFGDLTSHFFDLNHGNFLVFQHFNTFLNSFDSLVVLR